MTKRQIAYLPYNAV